MNPEDFNITKYTWRETVNGKVLDCHQDVDLNSKKLTKLPFQFGIVNGNFNCDNNNLTSLKGAPEKCEIFYCSYNKLTSLNGAPEKCEIFYCHDNKLTSLKGAPRECKEFYCSYNNLTSLKGAPKECKIFYCSYNNLTSLKGAPKECEEFYCSNNPFLPDDENTYEKYNDKMRKLKLQKILES